MALISIWLAFYGRESNIAGIRHELLLALADMDIVEYENMNRINTTNNMAMSLAMTMNLAVAMNMTMVCALHGEA